MLLAFLLAPVLLVPTLFVGWLLYSSWHVQERYREGERFTDSMRTLETHFREHFHGRQDYPAYSLDDLRTNAILPPQDLEFIGAHAGKYTPFSPATPEDAVVLTIRENLFSTWDLTKDELTREPRKVGTVEGNR